MTRCSHRLVVPHWVTLLFLLFAQNQLLFKASKTLIIDLLAQNCLKTSLGGRNYSRQFSMYLRVASVCYWYCARRWRYTKFWMHNMAAVQGILWMAERFKWDTAKTGTITLLSTFFSLPLHCVTGLHGLLSQVKPGNGRIIAHGWINFSILECCLRKEITLFMNCWSTLR